MQQSGDNKYLAGNGLCVTIDNECPEGTELASRIGISTYTVRNILEWHCSNGICTVNLGTWETLSNYRFNFTDGGTGNNIESAISPCK